MNKEIKMEILSTEEIFEKLCDNCGTNFHEEPNTRWVRVEDIIKFSKDAERDPEGILILLLRKLNK